jgi:Tfp pilus assembly PilM family ATPase
MLRFLAKKPALGLEITSTAMRLAAISGKGAEASVIGTARAVVPPGMVNESYGMPNLDSTDELSRLLRDCLIGLGRPDIRRVALSLPDSVFRVQTLEFDTLPGKAADRERLIRWRLEKTAAFDAAETALRYEVLRGQDRGLTVLVCVAKQNVLSQYEAVLAVLGLEPWSIGLSSLSTLNFYATYLTKKSPVAVLAHVTDDAFATVIVENGGVRFYRHKEIKDRRSRVRADAPSGQGGNECRTRIIREIEDSIHFYSHMDRTHAAEIGHLFVAGDASACTGLAEALHDRMAVTVELLSPAVVLSRGQADPDLAAALGAGGSL